MAYLLKQNVSITVVSRMLTKGNDLIKDFFGIGHIEISTKTKVSGAPVVPTQQGVHILQAFLACCTVTKVPHVDFSCERNVFLCVIHIGIALKGHIFYRTEKRRKDFLNGI